MPCYPDIASPCPVADRLDEVMEGDFCRACSQTVVDLDTMSHTDRYRLMAKTGGDVCVRYRLPGAAALAAAAMIATGIAVPAAAAQDTTIVSSDTDPAVYDEIVVGGARKLTRQERYQMERQARAEERREKRLKRRAEKVARSPAS